PGTTEPVTSADEVVRLGEELGWPLAIKAAAGGGGKGFRVVGEAGEAERAFESASREGEAYFSDPAVYVERYVEDPRHVEGQVQERATAMATGLVFVREQVLGAAGEPVWLRQEDVRLAGHALECRINAEDPSNGFVPSPGRITSYREPGGPGVSVDSGVAAGS